MSLMDEVVREMGADRLKGVDEPYQDGFNIKSVIGGLFLGFVMLPGAIYLSLVAGAQGQMQTAGQWVTVILFTEIARRTFTRMKRQELVILHLLAGGLVVAGGPFFALIWNQYLVQSSEAQAFGIVDELAKLSWLAPPPGSEALKLRSFLHKAWAPAILVIIISQILDRLNQFSFGYVLFRLTSDVEKLPFPMAPIAAEGATALAESYEKEETWRWRLFSIGASLGMIFGILYIVFPTITGGITNRPIQMLPIPWIDLTMSVEKYLPAALFGIGTDAAAIFVGFVLPFWLVLGQFVASIAVHMVANPILFKLGILTKWQPGMGSIPTSMANNLDVWLSFEIGTRLVIALLGIAFVAKMFLSRKAKASSWRALKTPPPGRGDVPITLCLLVWAFGTSGMIYLCHRLIPTFPWWIFAIYGFVWTPLNSYITARMVGIAGQGVVFPYIREASFILSTRYLGYSGVGIWFAPIPLADHGGMAQFFKTMELTKTKFTSIWKSQLFIFPLLLVCSILFSSFLWRISPIPSSAYPFAAKMWPLQAYYTCLWATGTRTGNSLILEAINFRTIGVGFGIGMFINFACMALGVPRLFFYGLITGVGTWPHGAIPTFAGALLGRYYFAKRFGREKWRSYAPVLTAGFVCGVGLAGMISVGFTLILKSVIQLPY